MEEASVTLLNVSMVVPATPTEKHTMFLAAIDIRFLRISHLKRIIFYKTDTTEYTSLIESLKSSLSLALVHFYPWAGRLYNGEDGRLALDCTDTGVEFVEASVDVPFTKFEEDEFQYKSFFENLVPVGEAHRRQDHLNLPVLSVQVTRFLEDGISLGFAQSHIIADGNSFWHFMNAWAECARGVPISVPPLHMRTALKPENLLPNYVEPEKGHRQYTTAHQGSTASHPEELVVRVFHFSGEMIRKLKDMTSSEDGKRPFTSFVALCAHIWKHVTAARGAMRRDSEEVGVKVAGNLRGRLVPPLPAAYFGNAAMTDLVSATAGELRGESFSSTAARIHEKIVSWDDAFSRTKLGMMEALISREEVPSQMDMLSTIAVGGSPRFPVYETDFGWGRPVAARLAGFGKDRIVQLLPGREGGGSVDVSVELERGSMERLVQDAHFLSF